MTVDQKPWFAVEVKINDTKVSPHLHYYKEKLSIPYCYQVVKKPDVDRLVKGIRVVSADRFLLGLIERAVAALSYVANECDEDLGHYCSDVAPAKDVCSTVSKRKKTVD